jgi:hypothetical protein
LYGEPLLLSAVAHIWDSLAEPRELRCTLSARPAAPVAALVNMLNQMLCARRTGCGTSPFFAGNCPISTSADLPGPSSV